MGSEPKIAPDGRLHALPVEIFAFNLGSLKSLVADQVNGQRVFVVVAEMPQRASQKPPRNRNFLPFLDISRSVGVGSVL